MSQVTVLGTNIDDVTLSDAVDLITRYVHDKGPHLVVTANPEMVMSAASDQLLSHVLERADLVVADGIGVVWASRILRKPLPERIPGIELMEATLEKAASNGWRVFLLGGESGVADRAAARMQEAYPGLQIVGTHHGFFQKSQEATIVNRIKQSNVDLLLVALGVPRQEKWAAAHLVDMNVSVAMGVGGSFNVWAGVDKRAPVWIQKIHLEWLYRVVRQPWRIMRIAALPKFVVQVLFESYKIRGSL